MIGKSEAKTFATILRDNEAMRRQLNYYRGLLADNTIDVDPEMEFTDKQIETLQAQIIELEKQVVFWRGRAK